ncbi:hypothetical protein X738_11285 [Mesorhizobium sp. LNHC209A00]|nr:hypothetical protein X738_11285 [Mesorhizobium sp. LNHC209A00]
MIWLAAVTLLRKRFPPCGRIAVTPVLMSPSRNVQ